MKNQVLANYLFILLPAFIIPIIIYLFDKTVPLPDLFKIGMLFPILMLAMKGLAGFFPPENLRNRPVGRIAEYAILQGLVFAAFIVLSTGFVQSGTQSGLASVSGQFAFMALVMSVVNFVSALRAQKKLRSSRG